MLETITAAFVLAVLVEGIIEYFVAKPESSQPWLKYVSAAIGVLVCVAYKVDVLASLGVVSTYPFIGEVLTGLVIGRGSNYLNDFVSKVKQVSKPMVAIEKNDTVNATTNTTTANI